MISGLLAATLLKVFIPALVTASGPITGVNGAQFSGGATAHASAPVQAYLGDDVQETITTVRPLVFPGTSRVGRILLVEREDVLHLDAVLSSTPDGKRWHSTTLPIVRERDLHTETTYILNVGSAYFYEPEDGLERAAIAQYRHHLRVYDVDARGDARVRVRFWDQSVGGTTLINEMELTLNLREGNDATYPSFAEIVIPELCHPFSRHTPCMGGVQMLEIEPLTPGLRFFPLVSATDNVTQQVTLTWPQ